uniref:Uncharacterized protein n=1 Tax=Elysia chlorotica TaxID=188477 RepID=A0A1S5V2N7_ELYCH|nr:hypothetical protein [Elysia chlorotica]
MVSTRSSATPSNHHPATNQSSQDNTTQRTRANLIPLGKSSQDLPRSLSHNQNFIRQWQKISKGLGGTIHVGESSQGRFG